MIQELEFINDSSVWFDSEVAVIGNTHEVRKATKLLKRSGKKNVEMFCEGSVSDEELESFKHNSLDAISFLECDTMVILAFIERSDEQEMRYLLEGKGLVNIFSYEMLIIAVLAASIRGEIENPDIISLEILRNKVGIYDFASRWLLGIRWVEESSYPVVLHGMPKTGTQAMKSSLLKASVEHTYVHFLNFSTSLKTQFAPYYQEEISDLKKLIDGNDCVINNYLKNLKNRKVKIITGVRDPIARNYSMLFQSIENWGSYPLLNLFKGDLVRGIHQALRQEMLSTWDWIEKEIRDVWGIDIYDYPFDKSKGYSVIEKDNVEIFLYRLESSQKLDQALNDYLEINDEFRYIQVHERAQSSLSKLYQQVRKQIHLEKDLLDGYYDCDEMRHFYSDSEIETFYSNWK